MRYNKFRDLKPDSRIIDIITNEIFLKMDIDKKLDQLFPFTRDMFDLDVDRCYKGRNEFLKSFRIYKKKTIRSPFHAWSGN